MAIHKEPGVYRPTPARAGRRRPLSFRDRTDPRGFLDEEKKRGTARASALRTGRIYAEPFVHDTGKMVYLVSGDLIVGNDNQAGRREFGPIRTPADRRHSARAVKSESGCLLVEVHYYDEDAPK